jgi:hypothetical protein
MKPQQIFGAGFLILISTQFASAQLPPSPPPGGTGGRPPQVSQLMDRGRDLPRPPKGEKPTGPASLNELIDYMDRNPMETMADEDAPVLGFGNELLWEKPVKKTKTPK